MNEPEDFLSRWSRRKHQARANPSGTVPAPLPIPSGAAESERDAHVRPETKAALPDQAGDATAPGRLEISDGIAEFDLSALPPIESITAATDIRPFLARGVPETLKHAALRRAWSADPAIRDFIGLAENQWDFTAPDAIPGFGPLLQSDDVRELVSRVMDAGRAQAGDPPRQPPASPGEMSDGRSEVTEIATAEPDRSAVRTGSSGDDGSVAKPDLGNADDAVQRRSDVEPTRPTRSHGRALPT